MWSPWAAIEPPPSPAQGGGASPPHRVHQLCGVALRTVEAWSASLGLRSVGQRRAAAEPSPRGQEVVRLLAEGATVAEVAAALEISEQAVRRLRQRWLII